ncbi:MAG: hypothetical protein HKP57_05995 [Halobacteria archaeon]|nr:hypothetical protein [Halobacteria archaeon]
MVATLVRAEQSIDPAVSIMLYRDRIARDKLFPDGVEYALDKTRHTTVPRHQKIRALEFNDDINDILLMMSLTVRDFTVLTPTGIRDLFLLSVIQVDVLAVS